MRALKEYSDSSDCNTWPKPLTDFNFTGLDKWENQRFKVWLGLVGEDEIEATMDQALELRLVEAYQQQRNEGGPHSNPTDLALSVCRWISQSEADKGWCGAAYECEFWQLVQHVPTQEEFNNAFPGIELEYAPPMELVVKPEPVKQTKVKVKPPRDVWTLDLFGGAA